MKSFIFSSAIINRNQIKFVYGFKEVVVEPYYIARNKSGKKVVFGRITSSNQVMMFEFDKIFNIKVLERERFSPIIPIMPV